MTVWQSIATAPRETGRPLLLYPYPYLRGRRKTESQRPESRPLLDVNDRAVGRMIKLAKRRGYVTYDVLKGLMPPEIFSPQEVRNVLEQLADVGINVVGEREAMWAPDRDEPGITVEDERSTDDQPKAPQPAASVPEEPPIAYSNVFEGYWDDTGWRTAGGVPCEPTHWMPLPPPPLTLVSL
jgi:Sigma-70 factor, region 1.1/Protein of unknown function (DUF551)